MNAPKPQPPKSHLISIAEQQKSESSNKRSSRESSSKDKKSVTPGSTKSPSRNSKSGSKGYSEVTMKADKKSFVRPEHLTQRPFRGNTELSDLKRRLSQPKFKNR